MTQVEAELTQLDKADALEYLQSLGVEEGGLRSLIKATYSQLGLLTYFTTGEASADWGRHLLSQDQMRSIELDLYRDRIAECHQDFI